MSRFVRAIVIVLDGVGVGALPDAPAYGDAGSDTLGHVAARVRVDVPVLASLGLSRIVRLDDKAGARAATGAYGRMAEASPGKDSVTGHWELMGLVLERPFPVFPDGFPEQVIDEFARAVGRPVIGNRAASGTRIIEELGPRHLASGALIVYTSADSVFQIAAHEDVVPLEELYRDCEIAYRIVVERVGVGRVIARPFVGRPGAFSRTANRRDYAMPPSSETLLDRVERSGQPVVAIGKIEDLFAGRGITASTRTTSDDEGLVRLEQTMRDVRRGLILVNLVDFDTLYGHRNDVEGFARNLERCDRRLGGLVSALDDGDLLIVTADHGNDPTVPGTDHTREFVPLLVAGRRVRAGVDLGTRATFADVGQTLADGFGVGLLGRGTSFLGDIME